MHSTRNKSFFASFFSKKEESSISEEKEAKRLLILRRAATGFTLLEILVAVIILALVWFATVGAMGPALLRLSDDAVRRSAVMYAGSLLNRVGADIPLSTQRMTGRDHALDWRIETAALDGGVARRVWVTVSWRRRGRSAAMVLETVRLPVAP